MRAVIRTRGLVLGLVLFSGRASAFTFETAISEGCHERLTADALRTEALRVSRGSMPLADAALVDDLPFRVDDDMRDEGAIAALLAVRDNDLKGNDPLELFELVQTHGDPERQSEHCLREAGDDEPNGTSSAIARCRSLIRNKLQEAIRAEGRTTIRVALATRGKVDVSFPERYIRFGQALHAFQDSFSHTYRSDDGRRVRAALAWVDAIGAGYNERRDGPRHLSTLDRCDDEVPLVAQRFSVAREASRALAGAVFGGDLDEAARSAKIEEVLDTYLTVESGCTLDNDWCDAKENAFKVDDERGCASRSLRHSDLDIFGFVGLLGLVVWRRRRLAPIALVPLLLAPGRSFASDVTPPDDEKPLPIVVPSEGEGPSALKKSTPALGGVLSLGAAFDRPALAVSLGPRVRLSDRWTLGGDVEWNPWISVQTTAIRPGTLNIYGTAIYSYALNLRHIDFRTTAHLGTSTLLYDLYGAPSGATGPYFGLNLLGVAIDLGSNFRLIIDPADVAMAVPQLRGAPLLHRQYRFTMGIQWGG